MGNTSGFGPNLEIDLDIYMSYNQENDYCKNLKTKIEELDLKIIDSSLLINTIQESGMREKETIYKNLDQILNKLKYVFICLTPTTAYSITQNIEYEKLVLTFINVKIIYFMMDTNYTPDSNQELKSIIKENIWFPLYDQDSFDQTSKILITILINDSLNDSL